MRRSYLIAALGIANALLAAVRERRREIGVPERPRHPGRGTRPR